ncbi:MAG: molybdopterin-binding protein [Rhodocyclaceae bacterium]|nr:molybdopterin-binding protein [Rhodocyclaceae bacterium]
MGFGAIIIGDEIIRGKRKDGHFAKVVELLAARGLTLDWSLYLGDDRPRLVETLRRTLAGDAVVFSFGGIGATPDDHTRQAAAEAAGLDLVLHPEAERNIRLRVAEAKIAVSAGVLALGEFPRGCEIVPNPFNGIPGFSLGHHYFVPGFPQMAWPMIEWVLDTHYADRFVARPDIEDAVIVWDNNESSMLPLMLRIERDYPRIKVFSLPSLGDETIERHLELGVRGDPQQVGLAMEEICRELTRLEIDFAKPKKNPSH